MRATPSAFKRMHKNVRKMSEKLGRNWGDEIGTEPYKINL